MLVAGMALVPVAATYISFADIAKSGLRALVSGDRKKFEGLCAVECRKENAVYVTSLMRAAFLACKIAKRASGRNSILIPRYACPSFAHGVLAAGMAIKYCDLVPKSLEIEPAQLEPLVDDSIAALIVPNLFGLSSDMRALQKLCRAKGILMIEGADYSLGGSYDGEPFGSYGDITVLNFQEGKAIPIGGGMVLSNLPVLDGESLARGGSLIPFLRSVAFKTFSCPVGYGIFRRALKLFRIGIRRVSMEDTMRETRDEFSFIFDEGEKLVGISRYQNQLGFQLLKKIQAQRAVRNENARALAERLRPLEPAIEVVACDGSKLSPHMIRFPILVPSQKRGQLIEDLSKAGFEASPMYCEVGLTVEASQHPGAAKVNDELLTLPCNWYMNDKRISRLASVLEQGLVR